jgi:hypothetical protein
VDPGVRPMSAIEQALLAVMAAEAGDPDGARAHISRAQRETRAAARRDRQLVEIASLVVAGAHDRSAGLALEHIAQFPADADLLVVIAKAPR